MKIKFGRASQIGWSGYLKDLQKKKEDRQQKAENLALEMWKLKQAQTSDLEEYKAKLAEQQRLELITGKKQHEYRMDEIRAGKESQPTFNERFKLAYGGLTPEQYEAQQTEILKSNAPAGWKYIPGKGGFKAVKDESYINPLEQSQIQSRADTTMLQQQGMDLKQNIAALDHSIKSGQLQNQEERIAAQNKLNELQGKYLEIQTAVAQRKNELPQLPPSEITIDKESGTVITTNWGYDANGNLTSRKTVTNLSKPASGKTTGDITKKDAYAAWDKRRSDAIKNAEFNDLTEEQAVAKAWKSFPNEYKKHFPKKSNQKTAQPQTPKAKTKPYLPPGAKKV